MGLTQFNLSKNICFYKYAHNSGPSGSPDMILTAFEKKVHEKKDELPPEAWNPQTKIKKTQQIKKMQPKMDPPEPRPPARPCGGSGGRQPPGKTPVCSLNITVNRMSVKKNCFVWFWGPIPTSVPSLPVPALRVPTTDNASYQPIILDADNTEQGAILLTVIFKLHTGVFPGGCRPAHLARADG